MMTAEKWYEHQTSYKKYGLEMKPSTEKNNKDDQKMTRPNLSTKDKARLFLLTIFMGLLCITLIISAAYSAQVKYNINGLLAESDMVEGEIENLHVAINSAANIAAVEEKAINELGMVYPMPEQIAYIEPKGDDINDFALALKQIAYNH